MGFSQSGGVFVNWPYYTTNDSSNLQRFARRRGRSLERPRYYEHRSRSQPPRRNYLPLGREFKEDTFVQTTLDARPTKPKSFQAGNLQIDLVETDSWVPFMRVRPRGAGDDAFLFCGCAREGFFKLRPCSDVTSFILERFNQPTNGAEHSPAGVFMDDRIWLVDHSSGRLRDKMPDISSG